MSVMRFMEPKMVEYVKNNITNEIRIRCLCAKKCAMNYQRGYLILHFYYIKALQLGIECLRKHTHTMQTWIPHSSASKVIVISRTEKTFEVVPPITSTMDHLLLQFIHRT